MVYSNTPLPGKIRWENIKIKHNDKIYPVNNGSTELKYIYWDINNPYQLQETNIIPTQNGNTILVLINSEGNHIILPNEKIIIGSVSESSSNLYKLEIYSTKGSVFSNGEIDTKLIAKVYKGKVDVTSTFPSSRFKWTRISDDSNADIEWNASARRDYVLPITKKDTVGKHTTFNCDLLDEDGNVFLKTQ